VPLLWGADRLSRGLAEELEPDELIAVAQVSRMDGWTFQERLADVPICRQWIDGGLVATEADN
jgi:hypothetical protein